MRDSQASAYAPGTFDNLTYQWVRYIQFCDYFQVPPLPTSPLVITCYAQHVANTVKAHATVISYLSGVKTLHLLLNMDTAAFSSFSLKLTLRGLRKKNTHVPRQAAPITPSLLERMHDKLDFNIEEDRVFWVVSLTAFFLLFRKSNLVPDTKWGFNAEQQLKWGDLSFKQDKIICSIRWTKTNQYKDEILTFPLPRIPGSKLCPVNALLQIKPR